MVGTASYQATMNYYYVARQIILTNIKLHYLLVPIDKKYESLLQWILISSNLNINSNNINITINIDSDSCISITINIDSNMIFNIDVYINLDTHINGDSNITKDNNNIVALILILYTLQPTTVYVCLYRDPFIPQIIYDMFFVMLKWY